MGGGNGTDWKILWLIKNNHFDIIGFYICNRSHKKVITEELLQISAAPSIGGNADKVLILCASCWKRETVGWILIGTRETAGWLTGCVDICSTAGGKTCFTQLQKVPPQTQKSGSISWKIQIRKNGFFNFRFIHTYILFAPSRSFQAKQKNQQFFFFFCKTILALDGGGLRFDSFAIGCAQRAASYGCHLGLLLGSAAWFQLPGKGLIRGGLGSFGLGRDPDSSPPSWDEFLLPNDLPTSQVQGILVWVIVCRRVFPSLPRY